jgi:hypothetical protein
MSGFLNEAVAPCRWKSRSAGSSEYNSGNDDSDSLLDATYFENTEEIELTAEIRAPALTGTRRANKTKSTFHILEESENAGREKRRRTTEVTKASVSRKPILLAQPAQRFRPTLSFTQGTKEETLAQPKVSSFRARRRNNPLAMLGDKDPNKSFVKDPLTKKTLRNAVYVPPDDTTVPSVLMGLLSPPKQDFGVSKPQNLNNTEVNSLKSQTAKRQARKSSAASVRRAPLQQSLRVAQVDPTAPDIPGTGGGKENTPPGKFIFPKEKHVTSGDPSSKPSCARRTASSVTTKKATAASHLNQIPATTQATAAHQTSTQISAATQASTTKHKSRKKEPLRRVMLGETQDNDGKASKEPVRRAVPLSARASSLLPDRLGEPQSPQDLWTDSVNPALRDASHRCSLISENIVKPALREENCLSHQHLPSDPDASTRVSLPTGQVFSLIEGNPDLSLSQYFTLPRVTKAVKTFNVRLVLGTLTSEKGAATVLDKIRAEEPVIGYREKTIALLWALLSEWGLAGLVDWDDVRKESTCLEHKAVLQFGYGAIKDKPWFLSNEPLRDEHAYLLHQWADILAALQGLCVNNVTASFANGKVYARIMDEYKPYIAGSINESDKPSLLFSSMLLESYLKQLGCSSQFGRFFWDVFLAISIN